MTTNPTGTGGTFTPSADDFIVEELPLYAPEGRGEHLYLGIEKTLLTTRQVVRRAVSVFDVPERDVGYAGLKDKYAVATQTLSVLGVEEDAAARCGTARRRSFLRPF